MSDVRASFKQRLLARASMRERENCVVVLAHFLLFQHVIEEKRAGEPLRRL